jgi:hypothetical protein
MRTGVAVGWRCKRVGLILVVDGRGVLVGVPQAAVKIIPPMTINQSFMIDLPGCIQSSSLNG